MTLFLINVAKAVMKHFIEIYFQRDQGWLRSKILAIASPSFVHIALISHLSLSWLFLSPTLAQ